MRGVLVFKSVDGVFGKCWCNLVPSALIAGTPVGVGLSYYGARDERLVRVK